MSPRAPSVVAHRGVPTIFPENTLVSLTRALSYPHYAQGLELDVRLSQDGQIYVFHDSNTERLAGVSGSIEDRCSDEIDGLRVSGETIPRLEQVIESLLALTPAGERRLLNVEVKMPRDPTRMVAALRPLLDPLEADDRVELIVSSFDPRVLMQANAQATNWNLALLYESLDVLACLEDLEEGGRVDLHPAESLVTAEHLSAYARDALGQPGRAVRVWTVDNPHRARALARLGVDAIITNQPARLRRALWSC